MRLVQSGPADARYMIVGEALGAEEEQLGRPFVGSSGHELYRMLEEARWLPPGTAERIIRDLYRRSFVELTKALDEASIFITNVCHERPPDNDINAFFYRKTEAKRNGITPLLDRFPNNAIREGLDQLNEDLRRLTPTFVLALGGTALWALTGASGITKWRGSVLAVGEHLSGGTGTKLVPTFHPADILREWPHRAVAVQDMRRSLREREFPEIRRPTYHFITRPSFAEATDYLTEQADNPEHADVPLVADIETPHGWRNLPGHIACVGFASSRADAICIPLMCLDALEGYWSVDQETKIVLDIRHLMARRAMIFHKGIFECQHFAAHWGFLPNWQHDTMVMQHVLFPGLLGGKIDPVTGRVDKRGSSLALSFLSSMYCQYHRYWKDDGRAWNTKEVPDEDQWWRYNCEDCVRTYECYEALRALLGRTGLWEPYRFMMRLATPVLYMMLHGMPFDRATRDEFRTDVHREQSALAQWINTVCGHELNTGSSPQMQSLFYNDLAVAPVYKGKGAAKRPTLNEGALDTIAKRVPLLAPLCHAVADERSLAHFDEDILRAKLDGDGRMHSEINLTGTETMRFASTKTPFGTGLNLQNINRMPEE